MTDSIKLAAFLDELDAIEKDASLGKKMKAGILAAAIGLGGVGAKAATRPSSAGKLQRAVAAAKASKGLSRLARSQGASVRELTGVLP